MFKGLMKANLKALTGCAWHTRAMSSQDAPYSIANAASFINSPAPWSKDFDWNNV